MVLVIHEGPIKRMFCLGNVSAMVQFNFSVFPKKWKPNGLRHGAAARLFESLATGIRGRSRFKNADNVG